MNSITNEVKLARLERILDAFAKLQEAEALMQAVVDEATVRDSAVNALDQIKAAKKMTGHSWFYTS